MDRKDKFLQRKLLFEKAQLEKLKNHPSIPANFNWEDYLFLNPELENKGINTEFLALRHYLKIGKKLNLLYEKDSSVQQNLKDFLIFVGNEIEEIKFQKNKRAIYTCISDDYDTLKPIHNYDSSWDYICFTNLNIKSSKEWIIKKIPFTLSFLDPVRKARAIKILPHIFLPEYDETLWIDGTIEILQSPSLFLKKYSDQNTILGISTHPDRICIYQEKEACLKYSKDNQKILSKQVNKYIDEGYPKNWGLVQSGIIYRKNVEEIKTFCEFWWHEVYSFSKRDQMSFNYVLWKYPIKIKTFPPSIIVSKFFQLWTHKDNLNKKALIRKSYDELQNYINGIPVKK